MARRKLSHPDISDEELVLISLLGNLAAFDVLAQRYRSALIRVAYNVLGSRPAAEDVAQDALLLAFKALPQLNDPANFGGWLCSIARHRARRVGLREGRTEAVDRTDLDRLLLKRVSEVSENPADLVLQRSENALLPTALRSLPEENRIVMELRYFEEWPITRIAEFLTLPATTVKWRLHMGRTLMRRQLTGHSSEPSSTHKSTDRHPSKIKNMITE